MHRNLLLEALLSHSFRSWLIQKLHLLKSWVSCFVPVEAPKTACAIGLFSEPLESSLACTELFACCPMAAALSVSLTFTHSPFALFPFSTETSTTPLLTTIARPRRSCSSVTVCTSILTPLSIFTASLPGCLGVYKSLTHSLVNSYSSFKTQTKCPLSAMLSRAFL